MKMSLLYYPRASTEKKKSWQATCHLQQIAVSRITMMAGVSSHRHTPIWT